MEKIIIGLTGPFGSGCSYVAEILGTKGYEYISLSDILRKQCDPNNKRTRTELQDEGNKYREANGAGILASHAIKKIESSTCEKIVVDSIRNTHEVEEFKNKYSNFYLFATWADVEMRWKRVNEKYSKNRGAFDVDDGRDKGENKEYGQQITLCYQMADVIILNLKQHRSKESDDYKNFVKLIERYTNIIEKKETFTPTEQETIMTMAYANSMRSSCSQRKVGALIIDKQGNIFSSGYNEVPDSERPCRNEYGGCYRKYIRELLNDEIRAVVQDDKRAADISNIIKTKSKMLDYCRALHAEETAIVNMARLSVSTNFEDTTLYTTTYPCNLCANKIAKVGIKHIVYYEPYPQSEAKEILNSHGVSQKPFEGVTFNSYFKFMEVLR